MKGRRPFTARPRRALIKGLSRAHRAVYRASSGRIFGSLAGMPVLLLTTTGRRSGKRSTTPLTFLRDRADLVLIALRVHVHAHPAFASLTHSNHRKPCSRAELRPACPRMQPRHMHTAGRLGGTGFQAKRCLPG